MRALSQSEYGELRSLYQSIYAPKFESILDDFSDEELEEISEEYIEKEVEEFFQECIEEGWEVYTLEQTIYESIDSELEVLSERVSPKEVKRRRNQAKSKLAASKGSASRKETLKKIKGVVKKVGSAVKGAAGLAARAVGTAQRAGGELKGAVEKGYKRGRYGSSGKPSSGTSYSSSKGSSSTSSGTSYSSSNGSSSTPGRRKDGLLKRGLKKLLRGAGKLVSTGAGAVKAGADYVTNRARKEQMNYNDIQTIRELYNQVHSPKNLDEDFEFLDEFSDEEIDDIVEEVVFELFDEGYEIDEIEDLFEDTFLTEGRINMADRAARRRAENRASEKAAKAARKAGADVVKKEKREERKEKVKSAAKGALEKLKGLGRRAKEKVKGAVSDAKSSVERGARTAAKKANVGAEKVRRAASGEDRDAERGRRQSKIKMKKTAIANIRKAVTGSSKKARRKDQTGSVGAGAAGTIRSKSGESGNGPSSKGRALGPKGTTSRTDAGNPRRESQIKLALSRAQKSGEKRLAKLNNSFDIFDVVIEFLCDYGIAEDLQEAQWIMVNEIDSDDIETILEAYGIDEKYQGMYQSPAPTYKRLMSGDEKARMSPGRRAMARSDELERSEPGSKKARKQKKAASQMARNFKSARNN